MKIYHRRSRHKNSGISCIKNKVKIIKKRSFLKIYICGKCPHEFHVWSHNEKPESTAVKILPCVRKSKRTLSTNIHLSFKQTDRNDYCILEEIPTISFIKYSGNLLVPINLGCKYSLTKHFITENY